MTSDWTSEKWTKKHRKQRKLKFYEFLWVFGCSVQFEPTSFFHLTRCIASPWTWNLYCFFLFFLNFGGHESFLWGHWYPHFGLLVTSPLGFKARVGSALFEISGGIHVMLHVPSDSPLAWHLQTSRRPETFIVHYFSKTTPKNQVNSQQRISLKKRKITIYDIQRENIFACRTLWSLYCV